MILTNFFLNSNVGFKRHKCQSFNNSIEFLSGVDHSKWAVAVKTPWICIGDLNREVRFGEKYIKVIHYLELACTIFSYIVCLLL